MAIISKIKNIFDIDTTNGLYVLDTLVKQNILPQRLIHSLNVIKPNYIFVFNNSPIILFFDKTKTKEQISKECWNFAQSPIIVMENESDFEIYNGFDYIVNSKLLSKIDNTDDINYISLISGKYFKDSKKIFETKNNKLDKNLLKNIKDAREELLKLDVSTHIANSLLGRIIFIRYLIDRKVLLKFEGKHKLLLKDDLADILDSRDRTYNLFRYLKSDDGFNGDWFPIDEENEKYVNEKHLVILKRLVSGYDFKNCQGSLFDIYDFSIIPVEFISNVYESFIGDEKQKKDGAYYTPTFLVDYILKYTVDEYFKNNPTQYNCKVLDPACGSGIFLVETFRKLIAQYEKVTAKSITSEQIIKLAKDNIFAIDKNKDALQISIFSLYLTMLDYQNLKDIEKFKFPYLIDSHKNKDTPNFFNNDFFDTDASYNQILKDKKIDFIVGNPPYGKGTIKKDDFSDKYIKANKVLVGNRDIVQPFMIRVKDIVQKDTKISFIVTSKVLYNLQTKEFREQFLSQFKIEHILELSSVRQEIFESATVPVSILLYEYSDNKEEVFSNEINYISMKPNHYFKKLKILMLSKNDFKKVSQKKLIDYDYLWKILVYGSYLDFNFIRRLKSFKTLDENIVSRPQGLIVGGGDKNSTIEYIGMPYIQTKQFKPLYIEKNSLTWTKEFVHRNKAVELFKAPSLLISKGISLSLDFKMGILQEDSIFADSITAVKNNNKDDLYGIMGLLYSSFFKYFIIHTASSIGIEREQVHNPEKFSLPYVKNKNIIQSTKNIENYSKNIFAQYDNEFNILKEKLDKNVLKAFDLTQQEYSLVDYATNIIIPWVIQNKYDVAFKPYSYDNKEDRKKLEEYVNITMDENRDIYAKLGKFFQATILWDKYAIGIYYKVLDTKQDKEIIWKKEPNISNFL